MNFLDLKPLRAAAKSLGFRENPPPTAAPFKSCWWLQEHLEFHFDDTLRVCCYTFPDSKSVVRGSVKLVRIENDRFPAEEIRAARHRIHAEIASGSNADCIECRYLKPGVWPERPYIADKLTLNPWTNCNLKCVYCFTILPQFTNKRVSYDLVAVIEDMLAGRHFDPDGNVTWGGGDISALPEFNRIAELFETYGARQMFKTSAFKYLKGVASALQRRKGVLEVSVDAGTRETYAAYKGRDAWDRVVENLLRYRENGDVRLKYIADLSNVSDADIDGFVGLVERVQPKRVIITSEFSAAQGDLYDAAAVSRVANLIRAVRQTGVVVNPSNDEHGEALFPNLWARLAPQL
jgi:pyruvate-formate lyase-activating enzyme